MRPGRSPALRPVHARSMLSGAPARLRRGPPDPGSAPVTAGRGRDGGRGLGSAPCRSRLRPRAPEGDQLKPVLGAGARGPVLARRSGSPFGCLAVAWPGALPGFRTLSRVPVALPTAAGCPDRCVWPPRVSETPKIGQFTLFQQRFLTDDLEGPAPKERLSLPQACGHPQTPKRGRAFAGQDRARASRQAAASPSAATVLPAS